MSLYCERLISENVTLRGFSEKVDPDKLTWHRDKENRIIIVVEGHGWLFQRDNELPFLMEIGDRIKVSAGEYHRILKGEDDLIVTIIKEGCWKGYTQKGMKKKGKKFVPNCVPINEKNKEKKPKLSKKQKKIARAAPPPDKITGADFKALQKNKDEKVDELSGIPLRMRGQHNSKGYSSGIYENEDELEEKRKKAKPTKYQRKEYGAVAGTKRGDTMARIAAKVKKGKKLTKKDWADRERTEKPYRAESVKIISENQLNTLINDVVEEIKLDEVLNEIESQIEEKRKKRKRKGRKKKKKKKAAGGLSAKVKKSLDKKADRRCLTRGSVYSEFRKGLAAWGTSGSRKGMSQHQWAHARVNSAQPSKKWATVKKRKTCPKKKKG